MACFCPAFSPHSLLRGPALLPYAFIVPHVASGACRGRTGWTCDGPPGTGCLTTGDQILQRLGFEDDSLWLPFVGLTCLTVFYNTLGYMLLRFKKPRYLSLAPTPKKTA